MDKEKISKNTWAGLALTTILFFFGGWSAGTERQSDNTRRISVIEEKCGTTEEKYDQIITKLDALGTDISEVKSDIKLLNATKADRRYEN